MKQHCIVNEEQDTHYNIVSLFSSYDTQTRERTYYKIFDDSIVTKR